MQYSNLWLYLSIFLLTNASTREKPEAFETMGTLVAWFSEDYDSQGLEAELKQITDHDERRYKPKERKYRLFPALEQRAGYRFTTRTKLEHDIAQFRYIANNTHVKMSDAQRLLFSEKIPKIYQEVIDNIDRVDFDEVNNFYEFKDTDKAIMNFYNRALFTPKFGPEVRDPVTKEIVPLLNPNVDFQKSEREWFGEEPGHEHPGIVVIDNLLSPQVLEKVRRYLLLSTFWYETKRPKYGKYVGAYIGDGMNDRLLMEIAYELHKAMPRVMEGHPLKELWSYKYESSPDQPITGIHTHADDAIVNVNLWITPDDANLDPDSGGLVIFTVKPPAHFSFDQFNSNWEYIEEHLLKPANFANVTVPHRQNRAVIFDSFLFHKTDRYNFKSGYENRRINLTFLYGMRTEEDGTKAEL